MSLTNFPNGITSFGVPVFGSGSVFGNTYFVDKTNGSDGDTGKEPERAFKTITKAVSVAGDNDTIIVAPGQYKEAGTINITQSNLKLLAANIGPNTALTQTEIRQHGNVDAPCITCNVPGFELAGFRITPFSSANGIGVLLGSTADTYGAYLHDNYFYCTEAGLASAIVMGDWNEDDELGFDCDSVYIAHNEFYAGGNYVASTGVIQWNSATRGVIRDNVFRHYANHVTSFAINIFDAPGYRGAILDNRFVFSEIGVALGVAVAINNPVAVGGDLIIDGNSFVNYAIDDSCIASRAATCLGVNYANHEVIDAT